MRYVVWGSVRNNLALYWYLNDTFETRRVLFVDRGIVSIYAY